jgi:hypothetical protein
VFVGRVTKNSGEGNGAGFGRMFVEEVVHGLPKDIGEVEVDTLANTSCYMRITEGSRIVLYGSRDPKNPKLIHYHACSFSFQVNGNEALLDALRNAEAGGPPRLVGAVTKRTELYGGARASAGVKVIAEKDGQRMETTTTGDGQFEFRVITPGNWKLNIEGPGLIQDPEHNYPKSSPTVPANGCEALDLSTVADGHIRGTVSEKDGHVIAGVPVQVFVFDELRREFESGKTAEAVSLQDGTYDIGGLPPQDYIVGVNADKYSDKLAYPPTFYGSNTRDSAARIGLKEAQQVDGINLVLSAARKTATVIFDIRFEDGKPVTATGTSKNGESHRVVSSISVSADDLNGIQRRLAHDDAPITDGRIRVELWSGETYKFHVTHTEIGLIENAKEGSPHMFINEWEATAGPIRLTEPETTLRVIVFPKKDEPLQRR